ncbi:MAG TPA: hypothetical protein PL131_04990 [Methylotenera sp.]|nr:hypothetical protein [Methylotenera sp.]
MMMRNYLTVLFVFVFFAGQAHAETMLDYFTDAEGKYAGPTVEDNVKAMDTDKNGFADASEVRAYLEKTHGKGYESAVLDRFESSVKGASCGSPFANKLYATK